jgi:hypothetical protein
MDELAPKQQTFARLLIVSLLAAFLGPGALVSLDGRIGGIVLGFLFFLTWIALIIFAIRRFRTRGLWLLTGAPFALMVPILSAVLIAIRKSSK